MENVDGAFANYCKGYLFVASGSVGLGVRGGGRVVVSEQWLHAFSMGYACYCSGQHALHTALLCWSKRNMVDCRQRLATFRNGLPAHGPGRIPSHFFVLLLDPNTLAL